MAGLKLTPIILKEVNRYLTSPKKVRKFGFDQPPVKTGEDISRPENPFRDFKDRNPDFKADGGRIGFQDGLSAEILKEKLPKYFSKSGVEKTGARKLLGVNTVKKILNLYQKEKIGRGGIAKKLAEEGNPVPATTIGRILEDAKAAKLVKIIPQKEMKASIDARITPAGEKRKIIEVIRPVTDFDRKNPQINAPKNATHKVFYYKPENPETSVIPKKFQGIQYYKSQEAAEKALSEKQNININQLKYKPQDNAVKSIHRIALKDPDDISNVKELSKLVYGNDNLKNLQNISNDLIRYQQVLLGFKDIKGLDIPKKDSLSNILSSFPAENEYGQFAAGAIRNAKLEIRDKLLKTKGTKLFNLRNNVLKLIDTNALNLDEVMGVSATFEKAPGYTELGQVIDKKINRKKGTDIDKPFVKLFEKVIDGDPNPTITYKGKTISVNQFNKISKNFAKKNKIETPTIVYKPGEKLDASKFINSFNDLSPEAQKNIQAIAKKGIVLPSKAQPISKIAEQRGSMLSANPFFSPGILKEAFKSIPTPLGAVALTAGLGVDPTSAIDRASIAAEAAFAPQLVKQSAKMGAAQRLFNLGFNPKMAMRIARVASPLGIASLGAEGLYQAGKFTKKRMGELKAMTPEQRRALRARQEAFAFEGAREGGIIGKKSGPPPVSGPTPHGLPYETKGVKKQ